MLAALACMVAGCASQPADADRSGETTRVKTMDEYRTEAAREITGDNAEAELDKLEKDIDADK